MSKFAVRTLRLSIGIIASLATLLGAAVFAAPAQAALGNNNCGTAQNMVGESISYMSCVFLNTSFPGTWQPYMVAQNNHGAGESTYVQVIINIDGVDHAVSGLQSEYLPQGRSETHPYGEGVLFLSCTRGHRYVQKLRVRQEYSSSYGPWASSAPVTCS